MVFRGFVGNLIREAAQGKLREAADARQKIAEIGDVEVLVAMAAAAESGGLVDKVTDPVTLAGRGFTERVGRLGERVVGIVETGVGCQRAEAAMAEVIAARRPQWVIAAGFAGGLHEDLLRGHYLMADAVRHAESSHELSIGLTMDKETLAASPNIHVGRLLTVDHIVRSPDEKRKLGEQHDALACDMETYAVAKVCVETKTRFLAVRIISDAIDDQIPPEIAKLLDQNTTAAKLGAATAALWNRPSAAKDLWKLKEDALAASDRLAKFLVGVIEQLPVTDSRRQESPPTASHNRDDRL